MASASPNVAPFFAVSTSLGAYPVSNWLEHELPPSGTPKGSSTASATVAADGTAAFTGLANNTRYFATDASGTRYVSFSTLSEQRAGETTISALDARYAPGIPALVSPPFGPYVNSAGGVGVANRAVTVRAIVPQTGTLRDLAIYVGTASGNIDVGIYSTAATRVRLYSTGSIACPVAGWAIVGNPQIAVVAGQQLDFAIACDNTSASFGRVPLTAANAGELPAGFWVADGAAPKIGAFAASSFPLPSTIAEASLSAIQTALTVIARVA